MAIQVIDDPYRTAGGALSRSLSGGLKGILAGLVERQRLNQMASGLAAQGVPQETASAIANLPVPMQQDFMKQYFSSAASMPQQQQQESQTADLLSALQQQQPTDQLQQVAPQQPSQQEMLDQTGLPAEAQVPMQANNEYESYMSQLSPQTRKDLESAVSQIKDVNNPTEDEKLRVENALAPRNMGEALRRHPLQKKPAAQKTFAELLATPKQTAADKAKIRQQLRKEALEDQKMSLQERKLKFQEQKEVNKETKEFYSTTLQKYRSSEESDWRLSKLKNLIKKGDLAGPDAASVLKGAGKLLFGIDLTQVAGADAEEFNKLSKDFLREAKQHFGSRMTQRELDMFMETIPSLMQSDEGKRRIIRNMKLFNKASKVRYKVMSDIIADNGGKRPENMELLVEERSRPELDVLARKFKENVDFGANQAGWFKKNIMPSVFATGMGATALAGVGAGLGALGRVLGGLRGK